MRDARATGPRNAIDQFEREPPCPESLTCEAAALLMSIVTSGATAFLIIMAMTFALILPRMLFERVLPAPA